MANGHGLCPSAPSVTDLTDACVRSTWATLVPLALAVGLLVFSLRIPVPDALQSSIKTLTTPFKTYLTLPEAEALLRGESTDRAKKERARRSSSAPSRRTSVASVIALVLTLVWVGAGAFSSILYPTTFIWTRTLRPILTGTSWAYAAIVPLFAPHTTAAYGLFTLYVLHFLGATITLGGALYDTHIGQITLPPSPTSLVLQTLNISAVAALLLISLSTPMAIPSEHVDDSQIGKSVSPEDYTTLWGWLSFSWVTPLVAAGTSTKLNEEDVWGLSPTFQSAAVFRKFASIQRRTLLRRIWAANSLDFILDATLTILGVFFQYAGPYFLKQILDAIADGSYEARSKAFIYAVLTLATSIIKSELNLQNLWYGRRAGTRTRSELMALIYDKALKRRDFSGIVDKDKEKPQSSDGEDEKKAGADVGKIVQLMSGDANRICSQLISNTWIYGSPVELTVAIFFLYRLLGVSAFAGLLVLVAMWPLTSLVTRWAIHIQKGTLAARDKRMGVLSELLGAVKFIKFFAWEERWITRVLDAREEEMRWMYRGRTNSICMILLWTLAPVLVSLVSFTAYVATGHKLDVATAFTAIALFAMVRQPLNLIPMCIVQVLQSLVALNRIATFLAEDEVDGQVSALKVDERTDIQFHGLGFVGGASFAWNEVPKNEKKDATKGKNTRKSRFGWFSSSSSEVSTVVDADEEPEEQKFELRDLNVMFPEGRLTVVTGPTASGKTALLMALLGEMTATAYSTGTLIMHKDPGTTDEHGHTHTLSYSAQSPWLRHQSIRDNILFGAPFDEERYDAVIDACALRTDLKILEDGDATEIGARGVSLSGGQKARVALARAVYAHTKYVLLDDPLSAVDAHTARALFENLLCGPLLANRTVILVTHHVELVLPGSHYLIRMLDGRIDIQGTVAELRTAGVLEGVVKAEEADINTHEQEQVADGKQAEIVAEEGVTDPVIVAEAQDTAKDAKKKPRTLVEAEKREEGSVKWAIYSTYLEASSYWTWAILLFLVLCSQGLGVGEKLWIRAWGRSYGSTPTLPTLLSLSTLKRGNEFDGMPFVAAQYSGAAEHIHGVFNLPSLPDANDHPMFFVGVYALIGLATAIVTFLSATMQYTGALRASRILFKQLLVGVVRATFRWHDVTPHGRMLNRFSKDIETIDGQLASSLQAVNSSLANFFASVLTVSIIFPPFIFWAMVVGWFYYRLAIGYLNTGRDLRRMESNSRSPIFSGFSELLEGIVTVRAFSAEQRFLDDLHGKIDFTTQMWYAFWMTNRWLLLRFDVAGAVTVFVTTLFALAGVVDAGLAGICITSAMAFTTGVYWACRFWTELELNLNSVERVVEYLDLPQEPPAMIESSRPPAYWPSSTTNDALIRVKDLTIRYAPDLPPVLHGVTFDLRPRERIGLLGRTGSGKSTLAMSVLRFVDPSQGQIIIDGIDISTIGIHDLRSRLTFIPQDATLFSGTLRENLDPFNEHTDAECLDVLHRVHVIGNSDGPSQQTSRAPSVKNTPSDASPVASSSASISSSTIGDGEGRTKLTLDSPVSAAGANFSQGQRQLIALARALLRRAPIIVLDEATSSIDFATDAKIQTAIREEFGDSLLLTVAHRLKTVIDYDRLIVLDKGTIAEFDTPLQLIQKEGGIFRQMCLQSGTFTELLAAAQEADVAATSRR